MFFIYLDLHLGDENFIKLANTLCSLPQLINIEVSKNDISDFSFKNFTNVMRSLSQIESLDFSCILYYSIRIGNLITDDGFIYFIENITTINTLRSIDFNSINNYIIITFR